MQKIVVKDSYKGESWGGEADSGESVWIMVTSMLLEPRVLVAISVGLLVTTFVAYALFK